MQFQQDIGRIYLEEEDKLLAEITFPIINGHPCINHTYVHDCLRGQGIAGKLMQEAMTQLSETNQSFTATCSYACTWLEQHEEYQKNWIR